MRKNQKNYSLNIKNKSIYSKEGPYLKMFHQSQGQGHLQNPH